MGTRGFIGWKLDGKVILSYQQYDSYPDGVGVQFIADVRAEQARIAAEFVGEGVPRDAVSTAQLLRERFAGRLRSVRVVSPDEQDKDPGLADRERYGHLADEGVSTGSDWYSLLRHQQGSLASVLHNQVILQAHDDWPRDSLFCEWGYLLDLDADGGLGRIEVYQGFQKEAPTVGEWAGEPALIEDEYYRGEVVGRKPSEYFPVNCVVWFSFIGAPDEEHFLAACASLSD